MRKNFIVLFIFLFCFVSSWAQIPMKKGKPKNSCVFVMVSGGIGIPIQHFASVYGDFYYHNASGFALQGTTATVDAGLNFPNENCSASLKTTYYSNPFDLNAYVLNQKEPPTQIYLHPGGTGVNYTAISGGTYKYISCLLKIESEFPWKKFSFGIFAAIGSSKFLSFPNVRVAIDSANQHEEIGFTQTNLVVSGFSTKKNNYGVTISYGATATYHFNAHFSAKLFLNYSYSHFVFNSNYITAFENGSGWSTRTDLQKYAIPVTIFESALGLQYRF